MMTPCTKQLIAFCLTESSSSRAASENQSQVILVEASFPSKQKLLTIYLQKLLFFSANSNVRLELEPSVNKKDRNLLSAPLHRVPSEWTTRL